MSIDYCAYAQAKEVLPKVGFLLFQAQSGTVAVGIKRLTRKVLPVLADGRVVSAAPPLHDDDDEFPDSLSESFVQIIGLIEQAR